MNANTAGATAVETPEARILGMIANPHMTRDDIAFTYAQMLRDGTIQECCVAVNEAIAKRWSLSGLKYVKRQAWRRAGSMSR